MNIAIIGCGTMAETHLIALRSLGFKVNVVVGRNEERTEGFANKYMIPNWSIDIKDALDNYEIDSVHVCTPPVSHYKTIKMALEYKKHVICEKPFVLDESEAQYLVDLAKKQNVLNAVGYNVRFHEAIRNAHATISSGKLGNLSLISGSYKQEFHALPAPYSWRYDKNQAGLMLATTEIGSHWIDLMEFLTSKKVEAVSATFGNSNPKREIEDGMMYPLTEGSSRETVDVDIDDTAIISFKLEGGTLACAVLSEIAAGRTNYLNIEINGSDGSFWWNSELLNQSHFAIGKSSGVNSKVLAFAGGFNESVVSMLSQIYLDIKNERQSDDSCYATFEDGLTNIKICNAIYKSAHSDSQWVSVK